MMRVVVCMMRASGVLAYCERARILRACSHSEVVIGARDSHCQ